MCATSKELLKNCARVAEADLREGAARMRRQKDLCGVPLPPAGRRLRDRCLRRWALRRGRRRTHGRAGHEALHHCMPPPAPQVGGGAQRGEAVRWPAALRHARVLALRQNRLGAGTRWRCEERVASEPETPPAA